jgi:hypothetical protein
MAMFNAKNMERLTELKVGQELPIKVLNAWSGQGQNHYQNNAWQNNCTWSNIYGDTRRINEINSVDKGTPIFEVGDMSIKLRLEDFIEFYNQFYKLDTPASKVEDWHNCVFYCSSKEQATELNRLLVNIGFTSLQVVNLTNDTKYVRTSRYGFSLSRAHKRKDWQGILTNPREFEYEEAIAALTNKPAAKSARPKLDYYNLSDVYFEVPDKETQDKLLTKLFELGYTLNGEKELWTNILDYWKIGKNKCIIGSPSSYKVELLDYNLILDSKTINNNYTLNNKTDGKTIIVRKPYPTVSRGERPKGNRLSGKTSRTAITSRPIRHRTIRG